MAINTTEIPNYRDVLFAHLSQTNIENIVLEPYFDPVGLVTIGLGFNIEGDLDVLRITLAR